MNEGSKVDEESSKKKEKVKREKSGASREFLFKGLCIKGLFETIDAWRQEMFREKE